MESFASINLEKVKLQKETKELKLKAITSLPTERVAEGGEKTEENGEESSLVQASRLRGLLPTDASWRASGRDQQGVGGGGQEDQSELEGSGDWRVESG